MNGESADWAAIERLRAEIADAGQQRDYQRYASLFVEDGVWDIPDVNVMFHGHDEIAAGAEQMMELWQFFVQTIHIGTAEVSGDEATGRSVVSEIGTFKDGGSRLHYGIYHDTLRRTTEGWRFASRRWEYLYIDTSHLQGGAPSAKNMS